MLDDAVGTRETVGFSRGEGMRMPGLRWGLLLGGLAVSIGWAQKTDKLPQLVIHFNVGTASNGAEVAYMVNAGKFYEYVMPEAQRAKTRNDCDSAESRGGYGRGVCRDQDMGKGRLNQYVIDASVGGTAADRVRAVLFIPGCEMTTLDVAIQGKDVVREAKCALLPRWTLKGQIVDAAITKTGWLKVDVTYRANWVSTLFAAGVEQANVFNKPLVEFDVASVPVSKNKSFSVELPILARDPAEKSAEAEDRGELIFTLRNTETKDGVTLGILRPDKFATSSGGLELKTEYPELQFVLEH
jgi:hypothetical protein